MDGNEDHVRAFLETLNGDLDEAFDQLDITPELAILILLRGGFVKLPPWVADGLLAWPTDTNEDDLGEDDG